MISTAVALGWASQGDMICATCKGRFPRTASAQRYCGVRCRENNHPFRYHAICKQCSIPFGSYDKHKYCSRKCVVDSQKHHTEQYTCRTCQEPFAGKPRERGSPKYCSVKCARIASRKPPKLCLLCSTPHKNPGKFCCRKCGRLHRGRLILAKAGWTV